MLGSNVMRMDSGLKGGVTHNHRGPGVGFPGQWKTVRLKNINKTLKLLFFLNLETMGRNTRLMMKYLM